MTPIKYQMKSRFGQQYHYISLVKGAKSSANNNRQMSICASKVEKTKQSV